MAPPVADPAVEIAAALARRFEGLRLAPYHDPVGYPTIGYGTLLSREVGADLSRWPPITEDEAERMLMKDLARFGAKVARLCPVPLKDHQRAALIDFAYNAGPGNLQASALRQAVLRGDHNEAARQFGRWVYARGVKLAGLARRRKEEAEVYAGTR